MATSKFAKAFASAADTAWDKAKTAEATGSRKLHLPVGSYIANLQWSANEIKKGDNKGNFVLVCKFTVIEGAHEGYSFDRAFYLAPGKGLDDTLKRLTKWLKALYPEDAEEISGMSADGIAEYLESDVIDNELSAEIEVDEYSIENIDPKTKKKTVSEGLYWQPLSPVDTEEEDSEEEEGEPADDEDDETDEDEGSDDEDDETDEDEGSDDGEDEDEGEDEGEDEDDDVQIQAGDAVLWKKPRARKMTEFDVVRVNKNGTLTLKGDDGKTFKSVDPDTVSLVEE